MILTDRPRWVTFLFLIWIWLPLDIKIYVPVPTYLPVWVAKLSYDAVWSFPVLLK